MEEATKTNYSHPESPVRHSYPLVLDQEGFRAALDLCVKTWPFIAMRLGILLLFTLAAIIWFIICAGIGWMFSGRDGQGGGGIILFLIAIAAPVGLFVFLRHYILYLLKLGHVAVLTQLITTGSVPDGMAQVEYGKQIVKTKFVELNVFFVLDALISGVAKAFNGTLDWISQLLPVPGMEGFMKVVHGIVNYATTYVDETIFSYNLARGDNNIWRSSADGLVYYAQNVKAVLKTAVWALVIEYAITFGVFIICLIPAAIVGRILPTSVESFAWVIAVILCMAIRATVLHPVFLVMVALTFHKAVKGQEISVSMAGTLESASDKFRELSEKAKAWVADESKPATTPAAVSDSKMS